MMMKDMNVTLLNAELINERVVVDRMEYMRRVVKRWWPGVDEDDVVELQRCIELSGMNVTLADGCRFGVFEQECGVETARLQLIELGFVAGTDYDVVRVGGTPKKKGSRVLTFTGSTLRSMLLKNASNVFCDVMLMLERCGDWYALYTYGSEIVRLTEWNREYEFLLSNYLERIELLQSCRARDDEAFAFWIGNFEWQMRMMRETIERLAVIEKQTG